MIQFTLLQILLSSTFTVIFSFDRNITYATEKRR